MYISVHRNIHVYTCVCTTCIDISTSHVCINSLCRRFYTHAHGHLYGHKYGHACMMGVMVYVLWPMYGLFLMAHAWPISYGPCTWLMTHGLSHYLWMPYGQWPMSYRPWPLYLLPRLMVHTLACVQWRISHGATRCQKKPMPHPCISPREKNSMNQAIVVQMAIRNGWKCPLRSVYGHVLGHVLKWV